MKLGKLLSDLPAASLALPCLAASALAQLPGSPSPDMARAPYEPHLVVRLLPGVAVEPLAEALGTQVVHSDLLHGLHLLAAPGGISADGVEALATAIKGFPTVSYAEVDEPTDPPEIASCSPGGGATGIQQCTIAFIDFAMDPGTYNSQYANDMIQASAAQGLATGTPLLVAVVDTGADMTHPLVGPHLEVGYDFLTGAVGGADIGDGIDNDGDGLIDEGRGHGTHVAGLILLADPNARILPLRALDSDGNGSAYFVAQAIYKAVDSGAAVVNLSLSTRNPCNVIAEALMYAEVHGVTVVVSAGNAGADPLFPASYHVQDYPKPSWLPAGTLLKGENVVAIASAGASLAKASFSCLGADVDLTAPGVNSYSAYTSSQMAWWSGTSMSAGLASGSFSFLLSIWGKGSYAGTPLELLQKTASDELYAHNPGACAGKLGAGMIQMKAAAEVLLD